MNFQQLAHETPVTIETISGAALASALPSLARLRIEIFRDWPYLYDGSLAYEETYISAFAGCAGAAIVVARAGDEIVGAATCLPLRSETENVQAPFRARGWDTNRFFYFGESVLRRPFRGQGHGVAFFAAREAHASRLPGCDFACFCSVRRPKHHPMRPAQAPGLDIFWRKRGYAPIDGLSCTMSWRDLGEANASEKTLDFWARPLTGAALP